MAVVYSVIPLSEVIEHKDGPAWVQEWCAHQPLIVEKGRYPTPQEIRRVLDTLDNFVPQYEVSSGWHFWKAHVFEESPVLGEAVSIINLSDYSGSEEVPSEFFFEKGNPVLALTILKKLSASCGPLIFYDYAAEIPVLVTPELDLDQALGAWG